MVLLNLSGGIDEDMGNWKYLDEDIQEDELFSEKSNDFEGTGTKISVVLPEDKRLRLIRAVLEPTSYGSTGSYCYADILFGGLDIGSIFYNYTRNSDTEERREVMLHGDGIRKIEVNVTGISGKFSVRLEGYYIDGTTHTPHKPLRISAVATSPDNILVTVDAPEDNGGLPLTQLEWFRTKTPLNESTWALIHTKNMTAEDGPDIQFTDGSLDDNEEYFYKARGKNSSGAGQFSSVVSATTEIDHPAQIPSLVATQYNSSQIKLIIVLPTDTGGVPLRGIRFERSLLESSGFSTIVKNTENLNTEYIDTGLVTDVQYHYRAYAINTEGKESLIPSAVASAVVVYDSPTNLTVTSENEDTVARLNWTAPVDTNSLPVQKYKIFRRLAGSGSFALLAEIAGDGTTYDDNTIQGNKVYEYYVVAVIGRNESPQSATSSVTVPIRRPTAPTSLTAVTRSDNIIDLAWGEPVDDGGSPITGSILSYSKNSDFANSAHVEIGVVSSHAIKKLDFGTAYYFKVRAKNALREGYESTVANATTYNTLFGKSATPLTVNDGESTTIGDGDYSDIVNNGTIICTASIIRCNKYTEGKNGRIVVGTTGCMGGVGGTSAGGKGGAGGYFLTTTREIFPSEGLPAYITSPTRATKCTDLSMMSQIIDTSLAIDKFTASFKNNITGGKGSDGTPAQKSGKGGHGGNGIDKSSPGSAGGTGGTAAQGSDGVQGGGKLAIYVKNINSKITILAKGNDGNDGNKGTGQAGYPTSGDGSKWTAGETASPDGTLGSKGSQGGLVILVYSSIPDTDNISVDVSGGLGGFGGQTAIHPDELTTVRNGSGDDGVFVSRTHKELPYQ